MGIQLNESALKHAHKLVNEDLIIHEKGEWERDKPTPGDEDKYLANHSWEEYSHWFLGVDEEKVLIQKTDIHFLMEILNELIRVELLPS